MSTTPESLNAVSDAVTDALGYNDRQRLEAALKDGWRLTPATFGHKITNGRWIAARHLLYISTIVATEVAKGGARLILCMPARHGKSEFLSVNTAAWFLETWPEKFVMTISYGSELATDFSLKVRDIFQDTDLHHLLHTRIRVDKKRVDRWLTPNGGGLTAAGIGGPLAGRGADLMLIDDYLKNAADSLSETLRKSTWEWFKSTAYTRLEPDASLIILATRWNLKDLIGSCLTELEHENWRVIILPALAEINDPLGREVGEALWPERYDRETLLRIKETLGSYWWAAMYQQNPKASMAGLDLSDHLNYISRDEVPPWQELKRIRAWDLAASESKGDWTAGPRMSLHKESGRVFIEDLPRFQKGPSKTELMIQTCADGDGHGIPIRMEQEPGSSGVIVIEHYTKLLSTYKFQGEKATGPIEVRASPFLAAIEAGRVNIVKGPWNDTFKDELDAFGDPTVHDDQIVACALGYNKLVKGLYGGLTWGRPVGEKAVQSSNVIPFPHASEKLVGEKERHNRLTW